LTAAANLDDDEDDAAGRGAPVKERPTPRWRR
jgi:hypothetical protein